MFEEKIQELPEITFNAPYIIMKGKSIPADADEFYLPIIDALKKYSENWKEIHLIIKLEYFNTMSSRYLQAIIREVQKCKNTIIDWYYIDENDDMFELAELYQDYSKVEFNLIKYK